MAYILKLTRESLCTDVEILSWEHSILSPKQSSLFGQVVDINAKIFLLMLANLMNSFKSL